MSKLKYILICLVALGLISTECVAQKARVCYLILDKDQDQKLTLDDAIKWAETVPVIASCDDQQLYTLYSFDISIFQRDPLMTRGFGTGIEGVPLMALNGIKKAKVGDTIILQNIICKGDDGNDINIPLISFEITGGSSDAVEEAPVDSKEGMEEAPDDRKNSDIE